MNRLMNATTHLVENFASCNKRENFDDDKKEMRVNTAAAVLEFVLVIALFIVFLFVGKMLWNRVAVPHITILKPVDSVWTLVGLSILFGLLM